MIYKQEFNIIYIYSLPEPFQDNVKEYFEGLENATYCLIYPSHFRNIEGFEQVREQFDREIDPDLSLLIELQR